MPSDEPISDRGIDTIWRASTCTACRDFSAKPNCRECALLFARALLRREGERLCNLTADAYNSSEMPASSNRFFQRLVRRLMGMAEHRPDPTRYAEHIKHGAGWKEPLK